MKQNKLYARHSVDSSTFGHSSRITVIGHSLAPRNCDREWHTVVYIDVQEKE
jgi:hypothetical protein